MFLRKGLLLILLAMIIGACKKSPEQASSPEEALRQQGRSLYISSCIACHSADPALPGSVGPELKGTSFEVLKEKVVNGKFPDGYVGKRPLTGVMPKFQFTDDQVRAIQAFLN